MENVRNIDLYLSTEDSIVQWHISTEDSIVLYKYSDMMLSTEDSTGAKQDIEIDTLFSPLWGMNNVWNSSYIKTQCYLLKIA